MEYIIDENRIYCEDDNNNVIAEITYFKSDDNTFCIDHTFVDDSLRGQGIAGQLVSRAVDEITKKGFSVTATCSYAKRWLEKNR